MKKIYFITYILLTNCILNKAIAQDIHFSQFYQTTILNNPAMTGIFNEDYRVGAIYRNQWSSIATPFQTSLIDAETKVQVNSVNDYISFGILGYDDKAGAINFQSVGFYPAINYNKSLEDRYGSYLSVGFTGGLIQRSIDVSKVTVDNQYISGVFNPMAGTGENFTSAKLTYWDIGAGVTFNSSLDQDNKINYVVGAAVYHVSTPKSSFYSSSANLSMRLDGNLGLSYDVNDEYNISLYANAMFQKPYQEIIAGGLLKWTKPANTNTPPFALYLGGFYRLHDAWIPTVKIYYKHNTLTFSYDVNNSSLQDVSNMHGGFEISIFTSGMWNGYDDKHLCPRF